MDNIRLTRDSNTRKMSMDNFSETRSNENSGFKINREMQQKMDLTSNKDIDIGLELLTNPEKRNKAFGDDEGGVNEIKKETNYSSRDYHNDDIEFDNIINQDPKDNYDDLLKEMNTSSRLSGSETDKFIDHNRNKPALIDEHEVSDLMDRRSNRNDDRRSQYSNRMDDRRSNRNDDYRSRQNDDLRSRQNDGYPSRQSDYGMNNGGSDYRRDEYSAPIDYESQRKEKEELLFKLEKYRRFGVPNIKKFNMSSDLEEMRTEYNNIRNQRELEQSVKFQRNLLITFANGAEMLNSKFDFFDFKLDGWSEKVKEDIHDYNEVFEELHEKYKDRAKMAPELRLMFMLGGSAFMYHLTNSMFKNSTPGIEEIMRQNPDLMKQFANAAINQMPQQQRSAANFFNGFSQQSPPPMNPPQTQSYQPNVQTQSYQQPPPPMNQQPRQAQSNFNPFGSMFGSNMSGSPVNNDPMNSLPQETKSISNVKIPGPVGVDDILNELKSNTNDNMSDSISISNRSRSVDNRRRLNRPKRTIDLNMDD